jgi:hypothetical protein
VGCLSSIDEILCSLLQGELASLVEFDAWFDLPWFEGELVLWCVYCIFFFSIAFASYSPKSLGFTCYTSLYLLNYSYHYPMMSSNEM